MKNLILTTALLVGSLPVLGASTDPATQQSLITAMQQASLFHDQAEPLQLDVEFLAQINVPVQGPSDTQTGSKGPVVAKNRYGRLRGNRYSER